jgi:hypothetical protein
MKKKNNKKGWKKGLIKLRENITIKRGNMNKAVYHKAFKARTLSDFIILALPHFVSQWMIIRDVLD